MGAVSEHSAEVGGHLVRWHAADSRDDRPPVLYLHGVPDSGEMWLPFLERTGGLAPDLPGFGRSGKRADFDYTIKGYGRFLEAYLDQLGIERVRLVAHDWGAVGLALPAERIERLVVVDPVPFVEGFRWHWAARLWRTRLVGEMTMGLQTGFAFRRAARGMPREQAERALANMDHGTQRAILRLYRSADPAVLARAGANLPQLGALALVIWGREDAFVPVLHADAMASALGGAEREIVSDAGHWPWTQQPDLIRRIASFLQG